MVGRQAEAVVRNGEGDLRVAEDGDGTENANPVGRIFDRVIENVEDGGAEVFGDGSDVQADPERDGCELNRFGWKVVALERDGDAVGNQRSEFEQYTILTSPCA